MHARIIQRLWLYGIILLSNNKTNMPPNPLPPNNVPPIIVGGQEPHTNLWQVIFGGKKLVAWVIVGVVGLGSIGGLSFYFATQQNKPAEQTTTPQTQPDTADNTQPSETATEPDSTTPPTDTAPTTPTTNNNSKKSTSGGNTSTGNSGGTSGGTSGNSGGGGTTTPPAKIALKIMPLGDSITQGGVGGDPNTINSYRLQLWNDLLDDYTIDYVGSWQNGNSSLPDKDLNGFSGNCIKTDPCHGDVPLYNQTAGWITAEDPDLVIMQGGGNDFVDPSMTETLVESYMEDWINLVFTTKPGVKIIVTGAPQWYPNYSTALENYVTQQRNLGKPIRYVTYDNVDTLDGTHPSLAGYVTWGDALAAKVRELFP